MRDEVPQLWGNRILGRRKGKIKGPGAREGLHGCRDGLEAGVARTEDVQGRRVGGKIREPLRG